MIALLRGRVVRLTEDHAIIEAGGVGYEVHCHLRTIAALHNAAATDVVLHVHTSVSADAIRLYGFIAVDELSLFRLLIGVERIGPKAALSILGRAELSAMVSALRSGDAALLATVPGIGRKTAERVVLELGDKLGRLSLPGDAAASAGGDRRVVDGAVEALVGLGFRESAARTAVSVVVARDNAGARTDATAPTDATALVGAALRELDSAGVPA